jgi:hypothetical protein
MFPPSNPIDNDTSAIVSACDPNDESCAVEDDLLSQAAGVNPTTLTANPVSSFEPCVLDPHSFS